MPGPSRRQLLGLGLGLGLAAAQAAWQRRAYALGEGAKFTIAQLQVTGGNWNPRPTALRRLLWEIDKRTSIDCSTVPLERKPTDPKLHDAPFLCLAGDRAFAAPTDKELVALRRFLTFGGFLFIDSCEGRVGGDFDAAVRRLVADLFPTAQAGLAPLPKDHVIYKSFYLIDRAQGRVALAADLEALTHDGRAMIVYSQNDMTGAFAKDNYGRWDFECHPDGEPQREMALRLGVNLAMYALCLDYKSDQVHVPFIMRRRRWKTDVDAP
jgi:hypothetical protein